MLNSSSSRAAISSCVISDFGFELMDDVDWRMDGWMERWKDRLQGELDGRILR